MLSILLKEVSFFDKPLLDTLNSHLKSKRFWYLYVTVYLFFYLFLLIQSLTSLLRHFHPQGLVTFWSFVPICSFSIWFADSGTKLALVSRSGRVEQKDVVFVAQRCTDQWWKPSLARAVDEQKRRYDLFVAWSPCRQEQGKSSLPSEGNP